MNKAKGSHISYEQVGQSSKKSDITISDCNELNKIRILMDTKKAT